MGNIIEEINVLEQTPIKDYTTLSGIFVGLGIGIAIIAMIIFFNKTKSKRICFKDVGTKIFLFWYILGLGLAIFSVIHFQRTILTIRRFFSKFIKRDRNMGIGRFLEQYNRFSLHQI